MNESDLKYLLASNPDIEVEGLDVKPTAVNRQWKAKRSQAKTEEATKTILLQLADLPQPVMEHQFLKDRKFAFDLAWPEYKVYCEIEGGIWMQTEGGRSMGHAHPLRFESDCEKYSLASVHGWLGVRGSVEQVMTGKVAEWMTVLFKERFNYAKDD